MGKLFWLFIFYSFLGFLLEVGFTALTHGGKRDRKCLLALPLCPVYGLGVLLILALPPVIWENPLLLFLGGMAAATVAEYAVDLFCHRALGVRFWDYSHLPLNLNGRVCVYFSAAWGLLTLGPVRWLLPVLAHWAGAIPGVLLLPAVLLLAADCTFTFFLLRTTGTTDSLRWYDRFRRPVRRHS